MTIKKEIILGIDPGTTLCGFGVVESGGSAISLIGYGCLAISKENRLASIKREIDRLIEKHRPDCGAIEKLFFSQNAKTAMSIAEVRGVVMATFQEKGIPVFEFSPNEVKQGITGYGLADKKQIQAMVKRILGLKTEPQPDDAADALAIAIYCYAARPLK